MLKDGPVTVVVGRMRIPNGLRSGSLDDFLNWRTFTKLRTAVCRAPLPHGAGVSRSTATNHRRTPVNENGICGSRAQEYGYTFLW